MNCTSSICCTWFVYKARVSTCAISIFYYTCMLALAFSVFFTTNIRNYLRDFSTSAMIWISCVSRWACTMSSVITSSTQGIGSTITWIYTFFISTCFIIWTFRICKTFYLPTYIIWISSISREASTFRSVPIDGAFCVNATLLVDTRILTFPINTSLGQWTLIVAFASWLFTDRVWISDVPN